MPVLPTLNSIKIGIQLLLDGTPYQVVWSDFMRTAQRKPVMRTKLKSLVDGRVLERTFKPGDKVETAELDRQKASFLYSDGQAVHLMNSDTFEQFDLDKELLGDRLGYLKEGAVCDLLFFDGKAVSIDLPKKVELKVTNAPPGVKGNTASNTVKQVTLETGLELNVPLFINEGEVIRINTETGEYVERASS